ncbi:hypothetical protein [Microbacterium sp. H1-D42]|uniref:hypothetical protein n=1 Tax=Microbacterium sp. H1-D42 TaxID=2925844 RepID=UPI001F535736|nr:hypothetical protein [Microbacterium sp. H1-D42]UNK70223.1 hypothetical protein MNR00_13785 [Microbacterium sp. H1-D42]
MESDSGLPRADAVDAVRAVERVRARVAQEPRGDAVLQLLYSVMFAAYVGIFVYTGSIDGGRAVLGGNTMAMVLPPMIISSALISGAGERHRRRSRILGGQWWAIGVFAAALLAVLLWGLRVGYPWWLSLVYAAATFAVFGARPLMLIARGGSGSRVRLEPGPLSRGVRVITLLLGVGFGALCLSVLVPVLMWAITMLVLLGAIIVLAARGTTWSLHHVGYEWAWAQWTAFGVAAGVMFLFAVLMVAGVAATLLMAGVAAALAAMPLVGAAFLPGHGDGAPQA